MNPRRYVIKARNVKEYNARRSLRFAILDCDKIGVFPSNFICILPQRITVTANDESVFARIFGENRVEVARRLLTSALESEKNSEIKTEIRQRLRTLDCTDSNQREK